MEIDPVPFEPRRFRTAAAHYLAGRVAYPSRLISRVAEICGLEASGRLLDLGCGPGQLAKAFSPFVREAMGVDPEPEMLRLAALDRPANVRFIEGSSYDIGPAWGQFRLVTMGRSFHWMDRVDTLRRLDEIIVHGGAVALLRDHHPDLPENAWRKEYHALVKAYSGHDPQWRKRRGPEWVGHESVLLGSVFCALEEIAVYQRREISADVLVDRALSMSSTSRAKIGDRADALAAEITALMARLAPGGLLPEVVASTALIATRAS
jgi:SAM-dependent methyltransferase